MSAKRKSRQRTDNKYSNVVNIDAFQKKSFVNLKPKNPHQDIYIQHLLDQSKHIVFGVGPAGSGKTYLSVLAAIKWFKEGLVDKIVVTRPAVALEEDLGFLPGTMEQKMHPWVLPVLDTMKEYFTTSDIEQMIHEGVFEISPLAYMGGRNFKNAFIIADEMQLSTVRQQKMLLTRISNGSKIAITGDFDQSFNRDNGLHDFVGRLRRADSESISLVEFEHCDIERHPVVKEVLKLYED